MNLSLTEMNQTRKDHLLVAATVALLLVPFLNKAFHIDDTLFLMAARNIVQNPFDFYGFKTNWYGFTQDMWAINQNPPLASYYIALASLVGGWEETTIHAAFLVPALFFGAGVYLLARLLCPSPLLAALMGVCTPVFCISATNVMSDVIMCAFYVWAIYLWVRGIETKRHIFFFSAAMAVCFGFLAKYFAATAIALLVAFTITREKKIPLKLAWLLLPLGLMAAYQWGTLSLYGQGLLSNAALYPSAYKQAVWSRFADKMVIGLSFTGGCLAVSLFAAPFIWRKKMFWTAAFILLAGTITVLLMKGSIGGLLFRDHHGIAWGRLIQSSLWTVVGFHVLLVAVVDMYKNRDAAALLLFLWTMGTFTFSVFFNWTVNGRTLLPMVPAVAIHHVRLMRPSDEKKPTAPFPLIPFTASIVFAAMLALAAAWSDTALANAQRTAAETIMKEYGKGPNRVWFQGHWGFQYYMEKYGAIPYDFNAPWLQPGDILVFPGNNTNTQRPPYYYQVIKKYSIAPLPWLATMRTPPVGAGFYADIWGPLPFSFGKIPEEEFLLFSLKK